MAAARKHDFYPSKALLKDVMTKQAGEVENGVREAIQNALDGYTVSQRAESFHGQSVGEKAITLGPGKVHISVIKMERSSLFAIRDWGAGIGKTEDELLKNFAEFGDSAKAGDDEQLGMFGIGRGQIISMIYDVDKDRLNGTITVETNGWVLSDFVLSGGEMSFKMKRGGHVRKGTHWTIVSNRKSTFDPVRIRDFIERTFITDCTIRFNKEKMTLKPTRGKKHRLVHGTVYLDTNGGAHEFALYDRGVRVADVTVISGYGGTIITDVPLPLNMSRNAVRPCKVWSGMRQEIKGLVLEHLMSLGRNSRMNDYRRIGIINLFWDAAYHGDEAMVKQLMGGLGHLKVIQLCNGKYVSLDELKKWPKKLFMAPRSNRVGCDAIQLGHMVLADNIDKVIKMVSKVTGKIVLDYKYADEFNLIREKKHKRVKATDREAKCLSLLNRAFDMCDTRELFVGESTSFVAWTDGHRWIALSRTAIKEWLELSAGDAMAFCLNALRTLAHELGHTTSNIETDDHGYDFERQQLDATTELLGDLRKAHINGDVEWDVGVALTPEACPFKSARNKAIWTLLIEGVRTVYRIAEDVQKVPEFSQQQYEHVLSAVRQLISQLRGRRGFRVTVKKSGGVEYVGVVKTTTTT